MKLLLTLSLLIASLAGFSQVLKTTNKKVMPVNIKSAEVSPERLKVSEMTILGQYEITKYSSISKKSLPAKELRSLIGTLVKIDESSITGSEINPFHFEIFEIAKMNSSDYIFREFNEVLKSPDPNLPETVKIHKTDNTDCYGIVQIDNNQIAIPYKGTLLFLSRK